MGTALRLLAIANHSGADMPSSSLALTLIGGPTVLIEFGGLRLLTDPTFDPPGLYRETPVRFEKTSGPALSPAQIGRLDAVLLSHDHHLDNLDASGRALLPSVGTTYTTQAGAQRLGGNALGLAPFETVTLTGGNGEALLVTATPARHGPVGIEPISGDVVGFALGATNRATCSTSPATPSGMTARPRWHGCSRPKWSCCSPARPSRAAAST
jgi:L-ascorbate metabolism protein UlaG (beta-lactamase superfamily)